MKPRASAKPTALDRRLAKVGNRLSQLYAQVEERDTRRRKLDRERQRAETLRRTLEIGRAVLRVVSDDTPAEIVGMLLDARERIQHSPTLRMAAKKRGEQRLGIKVPIKHDVADATSETPSALAEQPENRVPS